MSRNKLEKFKETRTFSNMIQWDDQNPKEKILEIFNKYDTHILELACGKGEYTLKLAKESPETLFLGIDIQGERLWSGAKEALERKIRNAYFLRIQIENILEYIPLKSIDEIWVTFPDPFLREKQYRKRLTAKNFLEKYKKILKKDGIIHLKTDSDELYEFTFESIEKYKIIEKTNDYYKESIPEDVELSSFERKHLKNGKKIKYLVFKL